MSALDHTSHDRLLIVTFGLFIFTSTFSIAISQMTLGVASAVFLVRCARGAIKPLFGELRAFYVTVAIWISWLMFTCLLGDTPIRSLVLSREEWLFVAMLIATHLCADRRIGIWLIAALAAGVVVVSIYGLIQYFTGVNWFTRHTVYPAPRYGYRVLGMFTHYLTFGNFFAVTACVLTAFTIGYRRRLSGRWMALFVAASALAVVTTLLTFSRGPIAAMLVTLVLMLLVLGRRYWRISLTVLVVIVAVLISIPGMANRYVGEFGTEWEGEYEGSRMFIWRNSVSVIAENPIVGVGMGNFGKHYAMRLRPDIDESRKLTHAHNDFLNVSAIAGIPGAFVFAVMWATAIVFFWRGYRQLRGAADGAEAWFFAALAGSICFLGTSMYEATWVDEEVRQLLMVVWGIGFSGWYGRIKGGNLEGGSV